jgi:hypothetical protein
MTCPECAARDAMIHILTEEIARLRAPPLVLDAKVEKWNAYEDIIRAYDSEYYRVHPEFWSITEDYIRALRESGCTARIEDVEGVLQPDNALNGLDWFRDDLFLVVRHPDIQSLTIRVANITVPFWNDMIWILNRVTEGNVPEWFTQRYVLVQRPKT